MITKASFEKGNPYLMLLSLILGLKNGQYFEDNVLTAASNQLRKFGAHYEICYLQFTAASNANYGLNYVISTYLQLLSYLEVGLAAKLYERRIVNLDIKKEIKDQLNFLLQTASLNFEEANTLIKKNQLDIFSIYKLHKQITIAFMDNFTDEEIIGDFIRLFKTEKPKGAGFSIFLNWICQKQCLEKTAYNLVQFVYKNFKPDWGNDYLVQKSLIAALLRFEEFDKFRNIRASSSHITDNELNGIDFKYNVLTDGVRIGYSDELVIRKSNKRFLGMTAAVYGEKIFAEGLNLAVMSLVTAKDFPELCNIYNVNITISTTPELRADIEKACIPLKEYDVGLNIVDTHFGGETTENKQDILYQQFYKIEKEQGVFLALAPDIIYGNGVLKAIINCPEGGAVIAPHVRFQ